MFLIKKIQRAGVLRIHVSNRSALRGGKSSRVTYEQGVCICTIGGTHLQIVWLQYRMRDATEHAHTERNV